MWRICERRSAWLPNPCRAVPRRSVTHGALDLWPRNQLLADRHHRCRYSTGIGKPQMGMFEVVFAVMVRRVTNSRNQ